MTPRVRPPFRAWIESIEFGTRRYEIKRFVCHPDLAAIEYECRKVRYLLHPALPHRGPGWQLTWIASDGEVGGHTIYPTPEGALREFPIQRLHRWARRAQRAEGRP